MIVPLREHQWRPPITHRLDDVVANSTSAKLVVDQLLVDRLELDTLVSIWTSLRLERGRLHEDIVLEGMGRRLHLAFTRCRTGPHCIKMIGWCPSLRATVAESPMTNRALAWRAACSKLCADK